MPIQAIQPCYLTELSHKDKPWDSHRAEADQVRDLYAGSEFDRYAERIRQCSQFLVFALELADTLELVLKLHSAHFCRVRLCPVCQWRRSLMWRGKFFQVLPAILKDNPTDRFIFLTLTVKNCELAELRSQLSWMNKSWEKLTKRKQWPAKGWLKSVEVTRADNDLVHPHFHSLLMVPPSYFGRGYLSQESWRKLWQSCLRVDYLPQVNVQAIKPRRGPSEFTPKQQIGLGILECLKYSVKPSDLLRGDVRRQIANRDWLVELTHQLHKVRAVSTGGVFRDYLADRLGEEPESLIHSQELDSEQTLEEELRRIRFEWEEKKKKYSTIGFDT